MSDTARLGGRGAGQRLPGAGLAGLPMPLPDEVSRPRLLDRLDARWQHPVTVVQAGAGFGKSTLLAQAVRANAVEPRGIDVWHACTPGDVDGDVLGQALLGGPRRAQPLARSGHPDRRHRRRLLADRRVHRARRRPRGPARLVGRRPDRSPRAPAARQRASRARRSPRPAGAAVAAPGRRPPRRDHAGRPAVHGRRDLGHGAPARARAGARRSRWAAGPLSCGWRWRCGRRSPSTSPRRRC